MPKRHPGRRSSWLPVLVALAATAAGCGGGGSHPTAAVTRQPPNLPAFLQLPVASPSSCPPDTNGTTVGRRSPWVGHVDVSVFVDPGTSAATIRSVRRQLESMPQVRTVYFESQREAVEEFARLYTCSASVPRSAVPASFRLVLSPVTRPQRDALVRQVAQLAGVRSVSCDPSSPCVDVVRHRTAG
ncbi:MAG TPA: permease-like cell division protein FtsX [Mycobacteriales bacterium]|nr:permease-like cell division protein FtsX [Mycobacteriales bacterium]